MSDAVKPGTARWEEIESNWLRIGNSNWEIGDQALEIHPMGDGNKPNGCEENLAKMCYATQVKYQSAIEYRRISHNWPVTRRLVTASWSVHQVLGSADNAHLWYEGMTVAQAREAVKDNGGAKPGWGSGGDADPAVRITEFRKQAVKAIHSIQNIVTDADDVEVWQFGVATIDGLLGELNNTKTLVEMGAG